jgi:hypothetical protein
MATKPVVDINFRPKLRPSKLSQWSRIRFLDATNRWVPECLEQIGTARALAADWDSYGSNPVTEAAGKTATRFLSELPAELVPQPHVSAVPGGGLGFHWRAGDRDLEIEFLPDGTAEFLQSEVSTGRRQEGTVENFSDRRLWQWLAGQSV